MDQTCWLDFKQVKEKYNKEYLSSLCGGTNKKLN